MPDLPIRDRFSPPLWTEVAPFLQRMVIGRREPKAEAAAILPHEAPHDA